MPKFGANPVLRLPAGSLDAIRIPVYADEEGVPTDLSLHVCKVALMTTSVTPVDADFTITGSWDISGNAHGLVYKVEFIFPSLAPGAYSVWCKLYPPEGLARPFRKVGTIILK